MFGGNPHCGFITRVVLFCGKFSKFGFSISGKCGARPFTVCTIFDKYGNFKNNQDVDTVQMHL